MTTSFEGSRGTPEGTRKTDASEIERATKRLDSSHDGALVGGLGAAILLLGLLFKREGADRARESTAASRRFNAGSVADVDGQLSDVRTAIASTGTEELELRGQERDLEEQLQKLPDGELGVRGGITDALVRVRERLGKMSTERAKLLAQEAALQVESSRRAVMVEELNKRLSPENSRKRADIVTIVGDKLSIRFTAQLNDEERTQLQKLVQSIGVRGFTLGDGNAGTEIAVPANFWAAGGSGKSARLAVFRWLENPAERQADVKVNIEQPRKKAEAAAKIERVTPPAVTTLTADVPRVTVTPLTVTPTITTTSPAPISLEAAAVQAIPPPERLQEIPQDDAVITGDGVLWVCTRPGADSLWTTRQEDFYPVFHSKILVDRRLQASITAAEIARAQSAEARELNGGKVLATAKGPGGTTLHFLQLYPWRWQLTEEIPVREEEIAKRFVDAQSAIPQAAFRADALSLDEKSFLDYYQQLAAEYAARSKVLADLLPGNPGEGTLAGIDRRAAILRRWKTAGVPGTRAQEFAKRIDDVWDAHHWGAVQKRYEAIGKAAEKVRVAEAPASSFASVPSMAEREAGNAKLAGETESALAALEKRVAASALPDAVQKAIAEVETKVRAERIHLAELTPARREQLDEIRRRLTVLDAAKKARWDGEWKKATSAFETAVQMYNKDKTPATRTQLLQACRDFLRVKNGDLTTSIVAAFADQRSVVDGATQNVLDAILRASPPDLVDPAHVNIDAVSAAERAEDLVPHGTLRILREENPDGTVRYVMWRKNGSGDREHNDPRTGARVPAFRGWESVTAPGSLRGHDLIRSRSVAQMIQSFTDAFPTGNPPVGYESYDTHRNLWKYEGGGLWRPTRVDVPAV